MSHYFTSGYSVREPMWHGLGTILEDYPENWEEARKYAGLDWEAKSRPVLTLANGLDVVVDPDTGQWLVQATDSSVSREVEHGDLVLQPDYQSIQRNDTWETLSIMLASYGIVHIETMGRIIETVLAQENVKYETAGVLKNGVIVWALAYLDEPYCVANDSDATGEAAMTYPYLAIINSFNKQFACQVRPTQIRVQCWNTASAVLAGHRSAEAFTFKHTGKVEERIADAKHALETVRNDREKWVELADELYGLRVDEAAAGEFTRLLIPDPIEHGVPITDRVKANIEAARTVFSGIYEGGTCASHHGTGLGLVDATIEYVDHFKRGNAEQRFGRSIISGNPLKAKAVGWVRELTADVRPSILPSADVPDTTPAKATRARKAATKKTV